MSSQKICHSADNQVRSPGDHKISWMDPLFFFFLLVNIVAGVAGPSQHPAPNLWCRAVNTDSPWTAEQSLSREGRHVDRRRF